MKKVGRPSRVTKSLDRIIMEYLMRRPRGSTWSELKNARPSKPIADSVLKHVLDRLIALGQIEPQSGIRENKAVKIYIATKFSYLTKFSIPKESALQMASEGGYFSLILFIQKTIRKFEEKLQGINLPIETLNGPNYSAEFYDSIFNIPKEMGEALATAVQWLAIYILDEINVAANIQDEDNRAQYLELWSRISFNLLISEITRLASPAYGDLDSAFEDAMNRLDVKGIRSKIYSR